MKKATIIIPNYNGMRYLPDCMKALSVQQSSDFDVLIVDNASTDGSREWIEQQGYRCLYEDTNLGFAGGVNAGIRQSDTPYVILLNNDTKVCQNYVDKLISAIERSDKIFSVSPMMIKESDHELIDDAGDGLCLLGWGYQRGIDEPISKYMRRTEIWSSCAGAAIYRRSILDEIGLFDEMHFAYLEDIDLGYRAKLHGYHNMYEPEAKVYHIGSATSGSKYNAFKVKLAARNNIYMFYKNQSDLQLLINSPWLIIGTAVKIAFFKKKGFMGDYISGLKEGIATRHKCSRQNFQNIGMQTILSIEWELMMGCIYYIWHYIARRSSKKADN